LDAVESRGRASGLTEHELVLHLAAAETRNVLKCEFKLLFGHVNEERASGGEQRYGSEKLFEQNSSNLKQ
jgi:hypothetical protein